eukprot:CAMPEP_0119051186 /NCGR_PEP_ID=MMETSP1177-20130426/72890_1 /TAXON_ID=2985 /ORGANISM="Ochromonas sp, Strain CCMP1899" /LENGTH=858 /DNA_ID=CAMNT_0007030309 /DNA_START=118 /DNA_END=2694 /DNA_ORIENTATION=-
MKAAAFRMARIRRITQNGNSYLSMVATEPRPTKEKEKIEKRNLVEQLSAAGIASAAVAAATVVNSAVGMRPLSAPDSDKTYVYRDGAALNRAGKVDEFGLPLVYDKDLIQAYWGTQGSALTSRWTEFLGYAVPFLTRVITIVVAGGSGDLKKNGASLAKDARIIFEKLGPTYIKMGQMMSVRPDVLPPEALNELKILQDSVKPFETTIAIEQIEKELGGVLGSFFTEISEEPVAAASLAQVYKARLLNGEVVAVKIQRPNVLQTVSKDLYVLRRAAEVYQGLIERFAPQQRTNYVALLNEWAVGFYTELDFLNEAANQQRLCDLMIEQKVTGIYIPKVYNDLCTRRLMVSEWIDGCKLSECSPQEIKQVIPDAQEAFLTQLLQVGFFHSDPHPGNILYMNELRGEAKLALIDFGLVASIQQKDMDTMISAIIHLANKDYPSLVDDFISLEILPKDCDRVKVVPLMDKALTPYVKGGGATAYETELRKTYGLDGSVSGTAGGFSAMTQDALTVLNDIPFSIPPYFALLARAIVTLEGVALSGDPSYGIILESYPFVARKLLSEDRPEIQRALQQVLYAKGADGLQTTRLSVLLNSALGVVARQSGGAFVDFDSIPEGAVDLTTSVKFLLSPKAGSLRDVLIDEAVNAGDILLRQALRKSFSQITTRLPVPPFFGRFLPRPENIRAPFLIPSKNGGLNPIFSTATEMLDYVAPKLNRDEEFFAISLSDAATQTLGHDMSVIVKGDAIADPVATLRVLLTLGSSQSISQITNPIVSDVSKQLLNILPKRSTTPVSTDMSINHVAALQTDGKYDAENGMNNMTDGLSTLSSEENILLRQVLSTVTDRILGKVTDRLQPLAQA